MGRWEEERARGTSLLAFVGELRAKLSLELSLALSPAFVRDFPARFSTA